MSFLRLTSTVCARARALVGLMWLFYAGMVSPSIAAYPSEPEVWWHFHAQSPATPTSLVMDAGVGASSRASTGSAAVDKVATRKRAALLKKASKSQKICKERKRESSPLIIIGAP